MKRMIVCPMVVVGVFGCAKDNDATKEHGVDEQVNIFD
jgi:hypothetical protein